MSNPFLSVINYTKLAIQGIEPISFATYENLGNILKGFEPQWVGRGRTMQLQNDEVTNNTLLAEHLRAKGFNTHTNVYFPNSRIVDIVIANEAVIECKQNLLSTSTYYSLSSELRRVRDNYKRYAVVYGDARIDFLKDLKNEFGAGNAIVLGDIHYH